MIERGMKQVVGVFKNLLRYHSLVIVASALCHRNSDFLDFRLKNHIVFLCIVRVLLALSLLSLLFRGDNYGNLDQSFLPRNGQ